MAMHMSMVSMRGNNGLETIPDKAAGQLQPDFLRLLRGNFAGGKGVDDMVALYGAACLVPALLGLLHLPVCRFRLAVDAADKNGPGGTIHGLIRVHHIADRIVQSGMDHVDFIISHSLQAPMLSVQVIRRQRFRSRGCFFGHLPNVRSD